jgi:hypothetical protein
VARRINIRSRSEDIAAALRISRTLLAALS